LLGYALVRSPNHTKAKSWRMRATACGAFRHYLSAADPIASNDLHEPPCARSGTRSDARKQTAFRTAGHAMLCAPEEMSVLMLQVGAPDTTDGSSSLRSSFLIDSAWLRPYHSMPPTPAAKG
jgi:hypothetical protein